LNAGKNPDLDVHTLPHIEGKYLGRKKRRSFGNNGNPILEKGFARLQSLGDPADFLLVLASIYSIAQVNESRGIGSTMGVGQNPPDDPDAVIGCYLPCTDSPDVVARWRYLIN
jgi:hypothetical protein